ncbi:thiazole biosynthesis adenylyltransferase ThiF [Paenibacillus nasutitermitis]|uniref:Thiazole biosynthesis adenylyltransferase ThiF n=1 Tax=Paenibacillus nasutitermitis TaxID=1652958 RepID=A0A917DPY0_9BACL|nr:thiazole biosynthesis adenylyltransferase ThiF [Paenibacillus nasutitermitis]GGD55498.1 thiazole biosynthesis adenylyltransferase ThiF [Paenibacillus nasutitermitis]
MNGRYSRQELFPPIGSSGQEVLGSKHVLLIGAGALGTGNAEALVRAGIGKLTVADRDYVEWSNLQRQQLFSEEDAQRRMPKAIAAKTRLQAINSEVEIEALVMDMTTRDIEQSVEGVDLIVDATDNFDTRLLINDISMKHRIPWIYGACVGSYGITYTILPGETPCLNCLLETIPVGGATCDTAGIISPAVQMVVAYQTAEALKLLTGNRKALRGRLTSFDLWTNIQSSIAIEKLKKESCLSCGASPAYPYLSAANHTRTEILCGRDTVQIRPPAPMKRDLEAAAAKLSRQGEKVESNGYLVTLHLGARRLVLFEDGRVLVHGTNDTAEARSLYHRYLG